MADQPDAPRWMNKKRRPAAPAAAAATSPPPPPPPPQEPELATLTVLRGMPSRAHVMCQLGDATNLVCYVRRADLFRKGMTLEGARPRPDLGPRAWEYLGKLPRRPGMW